MNESQLNGATKSYGVALGIASILSALLVVVKEMNEGILNTMKAITVHHWVTQALFIVVTFLILGFILSKSRNGRGPNVSDSAVLRFVVGGVALSTVMIALFYWFD
jgi:hypothetical protein